MKSWYCCTRGGLFGFVVICVLVAGGLGWVTRAAVRLEQEQLAGQVHAEHTERLRLALWRLDSRIGTILAREDSRPFSHYSAIFAPPVALDGAGRLTPPGSVVEPSPLLHVPLSSWMLLHFQADAHGWESPQVLSVMLRQWLVARPVRLALGNVNNQREQLLADLARDVPGGKLLAHARQHAGDTTIRDRVVLARKEAEQLQQQLAGNNTLEVKDQEAYRDYFYRRGGQSKLNPTNQVAAERVAKNVALLNFSRNGEEWLHTTQTPPQSWSSTLSPELQPRTYFALQLPRVPPSAEVEVSMSPMVGVWVPTATGSDRLMVLRLVRLEEKEICQGIVLDGTALANLLAEEVRDLFPEASVRPARPPLPEQLAQTMTALPLRLDPGPLPAVDDPGWTPLRVGLSLAWAAALVALLAVGLGGWSLLDLSERRIRFVSAVTHELRTPLTTLRLYLDMMLGGMIRDEETRAEYLRTLDGETDRLTRLVGNVLDFSRLENQRQKVELASLRVDEVLASLGATWKGRCEIARKDLIVENSVGPEVLLRTDGALLGQVLGNLIDNACKYSREAGDHRIWLRSRCEGRHLVLEVEDRGPGVPAGDRRIIFRPFRRGRSSDTITGGVGLGLALAERWTRMLGGKLTLHAPAEGGACFRVELPVA